MNTTLNTTLLAVNAALLAAVLAVTATFAVYQYERDSAADAGKMAFVTQQRDEMAAAQAREQAIADELQRRQEARKNANPTITFHSRW